MDFHFAFVNGGDDTWLPAYARNDFGDDQPFSWIMVQEEGDFATLSVTLPAASAGGWLAPGKKRWLWFALDDGSTAGPTPMFFGRIRGTPDQGAEGEVTLVFRARPRDWESQRAALAETLKVAPWWDPVWLTEEERDNPDAVLFARAGVWHIDPVTHVVSLTSTVTGEAGTIVLSDDDMLWEDYLLRVVGTPLRAIDVDCTVSWTQTAEGLLDITSEVLRVFREATDGSVLDRDYGSIIGNLGADVLSGRISTMSESGDAGGFGHGNWPEDGDRLGDVWTFGPSEVQGGSQTVVVFGHGGRLSGITQISLFPLWTYVPTLSVRYSVERTRSERVRFTLVADTQDVDADPGEGEVEDIHLSSTAIAEPVDPATTANPDGVLPIGTIADRRYFQKARGIRSFEWLLARAVARHLVEARAVAIDVGAPLGDSLDWTLKHSMTVPDDRLPGATATGKVVRIERSFDGSAMRARATVGVMVGKGGTVAEVAGDNDYVEDGYIEAGYHVATGETTAPFGSNVTWTNYGNQTLDDDGLDFVGGLTIEQAVSEVSVSNPAAAQLEALVGDGDTFGFTPAFDFGPYEIGWGYKSLSYSYTLAYLEENNTQVCVEMVPVRKDAFESIFDVDVSVLKVPKGIDLEVAS